MKRFGAWLKENEHIATWGGFAITLVVSLASCAALIVEWASKHNIDLPVPYKGVTEMPDVVYLFLVMTVTPLTVLACVSAYPTRGKRFKKIAHLMNDALAVFAIKTTSILVKQGNSLIVEDAIIALRRFGIEFPFRNNEHHNEGLRLIALMRHGGQFFLRMSVLAKNGEYDEAKKYGGRFARWANGERGESIQWFSP